MGLADIGLIGLAVMGQNLALNINDNGFTVAVFNRTVSKVDEFLAGPAKGTAIIGTHSLEQLFKGLKRPRRVLLMVKAGDPVDEFINLCLPYMEPGDILIDGGNSLFTDTHRRCDALAEKKMIFIGMGVSGGEEGARHGPSLMPGGNPAGWEHVKPIFQKICAKAESGEPCCEWVGSGGAGHYVKMVHNGIEYGDMQLIGEAYQFLKVLLDAEPPELHQIFKGWNQGELNSYLIEITSDIFQYKDTDGTPLVDKILDVAGQKGTGKWTVNNALDLGIPLTLIAEAVFARNLSGLKEERVEASRYLESHLDPFVGNRESCIEQIRRGLYASKIISYTQGFMLMRQASKEYKWELNYANVAAIWRGGCIIRSRFLDDIRKAYHTNPDLPSLLLDPFFKKEIKRMEEGWRKSVCTAIEQGIPTPCMSTALTFYDGYRCANLPVNLLQAQRDYFGAHTYERIDKPRGQFFHTNWTGRGGDVSSSSYNA